MNTKTQVNEARFARARLLPGGRIHQGDIPARSSKHSDTHEMHFYRGKLKNPGQMNCPGLAASVDAHAVGFRKGESTRLTVRWKQVIAPSYTGVGYPVDVRINQTSED
jgi:hypothetical protein